MEASPGRRGATGLFSSARNRRRAGWLGVLFGIAGTIVLLIVVLPRTNGMKLPSTRSGKPTIVAPAPKHVRLGRADEAAARLVAAKFVATAVLRRNVDASWSLTAPELRAGLTRSQWHTGAIPVIPFPADQLDSVRWRLDYTIKDTIGLKVAMLPKAHASVQALDFEMELVKRGAPAKQHWLVDYWAPLSPGTASPEERAKNAAAIAASAPQPIGSAWLLLPIVFLLLAVLLVPAVLIVRGKMRHSRAERAYRESVAERDALSAQTSSSSPS